MKTTAAERNKGGATMAVPVIIKITCRECRQTEDYTTDAVSVIIYSHGLFGYEYFCRNCYAYDCRPTIGDAAVDLMEHGCKFRCLVVAGEFLDQDVRHRSVRLAMVSKTWIDWWVAKYLTPEATGLMDCELAALEVELDEIEDDSERSRQQEES